MSLKPNIIATYGSQLYVTLIGIALVPVYVQHLGSEAYGLIGFFAMLQGWLTLLDFGLSQTVVREAARHHGGATNALAYRRLYRSLNLILLTLAIIGLTVLLATSELIAINWLKIETLDRNEVQSSIQIMAICAALRLLSGLYRGIISGNEFLVWLGTTTATIATVKFVGVLGSMYIFGFTVQVFFYHQLAVALLEFVTLYLKASSLLPPRESMPEKIGWSINLGKGNLKFSLTIAFTSTIWVLVTQADKLVLSGILPLAEYGQFTIATLVAGGVLMITGPVSSILMPRLANLHAANEDLEFIEIYKKATQWTTIVGGSVTIVLAIYAKPLLIMWTANEALSQSTAPILRLYAIGNFLLAIGAFPYYMQYAMGKLRYHFIGQLVLASMLIPAISVSAYYFGGIGAACTWATLNLLYLALWTAITHRKLLPGRHWEWIYQGFIKCFGLALISATLITYTLPHPESNLEVLFSMLTTLFATAAGSLVSLKTIRDRIIRHADHYSK